MVATNIESITQALLHDLRGKLDEAASIAKAAEACADNGNVKHAIQILMDFEGLAHEAQELFRAALTLKRTFMAEAE